MIHYRPFLNWDPPALAEIWRQQPTLLGRMQPMTSALFEELVFSKQYFEREGFIIALEDSRPIGFVHAGFGSQPDGSGIDNSIGIICMLMTVPHDRRGEISVELLNAAEDYLRKRGAQRMLAGCAPPHDPYYLGLYGGARGLGVLEGEQLWNDVLRLENYVPREHWKCWRRSLLDFSPVLDRDQMQLRRKWSTIVSSDMPTDNWWEACNWGHVVRTRYDLLPRRGNDTPAASAWIWDVQPLARSEGAHAAGLIRCQTTTASADELKFLLSEVMQQLQQEQVVIFEATLSEQDQAQHAMLEQLGCEPNVTGVVWEKS